VAVIRNVVVRIAADISQLQKSLKEAQDTIASIGSKLTGVGKEVSAALTLLIAGMGAAMLKECSRYSLELGGKLGVRLCGWHQVRDRQGGQSSIQQAFKDCEHGKIVSMAKSI